MTPAEQRSFHSVLEILPWAVFSIDRSGLVIEWNRAAEETLGWTQAEVIGHPLPGIREERQPEIESALRRAHDSDTRVTIEGDWLHKSGRPIRVRLWLMKLDPVRTVGAFEDITHGVRLEEQLRQSQKMEAIGRLAGGVAHDFNNLLTVISGYAQSLLELGNTLPPERIRTELQEISRAADRAAELTKQLLTFSRRQVSQPKIISLPQLVGNLERVLRRLIGEDIDLVVRSEPGPLLVNANPGELEQVIMNLAVNSRDAMPKGGTLTITVASVDRLPERSFVQNAAQPYVSLSVADTGVGMDENLRSHLFEPFFTTKPSGQGTGLGLAMVYGIVTQSGGHIVVESQPARGTAVCIYLPKADEPVAPISGGQVKPSAGGGHETILVVEDEAGVRALIVRILMTLGYLVLEAADPVEAFGLSTRHSGPIHLLLTDITMPHLSGPELADKLIASRPSIKVLYMSGYTDSALELHTGSDSDINFLKKPFLPRTLAETVRAVLGIPK